MNDQAAEAKPSLILRTANQSRFVSYLVGGAYELRSQGLINLRYGRAPEIIPSRDRDAFAWFDCVFPEQGKPLKVCLDLVDYRELPLSAAIDAADVYLKRSYCKNYVSSLPQVWQQKIMPIGIHVPHTCREESGLDRIQRRVYARPKAGMQLKELGPLMTAPFRGVLHDLRIGRRLPPALGSLPEVPVQDKIPGVYFRTRVFDASKNPDPSVRTDLAAINDCRMRVVRALREAFGDRYVGGIYETPAAKKLCPELIHEMPGKYRDTQGHLRLSRQYLINVSTRGVSRSTPWKFPEILASGSVLVSEPPSFSHQSMPTCGRHYVAFNSPDDCVKACKTLLANPQRAHRIGSEGRAFYETEIDPAQALRVTLERMSRRFFPESSAARRSQLVPAVGP